MCLGKDGAETKTAGDILPEDATDARDRMVGQKEDEEFAGSVVGGDRKGETLS